MEPPITWHGPVNVSYHQLLLVDGKIDASHPTRIPNGLVASWPDATVIRTGIHTGAISVVLQLHSSPPAIDLQHDWDEIADISMESTTGSLGMTRLMSDPPQDLGNLAWQGPGHYRLRVYTRGRDTNIDGVANGEPVEDYLLQIWSAPPSADIIHKQSDSYGAGLRASATRLPPEAQPSRPSAEPGPATTSREKAARLTEWARQRLGEDRKES